MFFSQDSDLRPDVGMEEYQTIHTHPDEVGLLVTEILDVFSAFSHLMFLPVSSILASTAVKIACTRILLNT